MPIRSTRYSFRFATPDVIERGADQVLFVETRTDGDRVAPSSGTCTVLDQNRDTVKTGPIVITDDLATFTLDAADTTSLTLSAGWKVVWALDMTDSRTYNPDNPAALVRRKLYPVLTSLDLTEGRYSDLDRYLATGETSWQNYIDAAWDEIQRELFKLERRPWLITEPSAFLDVHRELTLSNIFQDIGSTQRSSDRDWLQLSKTHRGRYLAIWRGMTFSYDDDETGNSYKRRPAVPIIVLGATGAQYRRN